MRLKRDLFTVGWASHFWEAFVADVPVELGRDAYRVREDSELLWSDPGVAKHSVLTSWSHAIAARGIREGAAPDLREHAWALLSTDNSEMTSRLLAQVQTRSFGTGDIEPLDYASFMSGLDNKEAVAGQNQAFDRQMFAPAPRGEPWQVTETWTGEPSNRLSRTVVVTQLSSGFYPYDLAIGRALPGGTDESPSLPVAAPRPGM
jgi:hypothetical protein